MWCLWVLIIILLQDRGMIDTLDCEKRIKHNKMSYCVRYSSVYVCVCVCVWESVNILLARQLSISMCLYLSITRSAYVYVYQPSNHILSFWSPILSLVRLHTSHTVFLFCLNLILIRYVNIFVFQSTHVNLFNYLIFSHVFFF